MLPYGTLTGDCLTSIGCFITIDQHVCD